MSNTKIDWTKKYNESYKKHFEKLKPRFKTEVESKSGIPSDIFHRFIKTICFEEDNIISKRTGQPLDTAYNILRNDYKEYLYKKFKSSINQIPDNPIETFITHVLPDLKVEHKTIYKSKNGYGYECDPDFFERKDLEVIQMIAKKIAYEDFITYANAEYNKLYRKQNTVASQDSDSQESTKGEQGTKAQIIIAIAMIEEQIKIDKSQDHRGLRKLISFMSGLNSDNIDKGVRKYFNQNGEIQDTVQKNLYDFEKAFEALKFLDNENLNASFQKKINHFKSKKEKFG